MTRRPAARLPYYIDEVYGPDTDTSVSQQWHDFSPEPLQFFQRGMKLQQERLDAQRLKLL